MKLIVLTYDTKGRGEYFSTPFLLYVYGLGVLALHAFARCATVVVRVVWHLKHNVYHGRRTMCMAATVRRGLCRKHYTVWVVWLKLSSFFTDLT